MLRRIYNWLKWRQSTRSPQWPAARDAWLRDHPTCEVCGGTEYVIVHHKIPYHVAPDKELDPDNFATVCEHPNHNDHLIFAHLLDWKSWNPAFEQDARRYFAELKARP